MLRRRKRPGQRGFSLIELVIVLALVGLSISLVTPSFSRFYDAVEIKAAAKKIAGVLRYTRAEAVQKGVVYQVLLDTEGRELRVEAVETAQNKDLERFEEKVVKRKVPLPEGIQVKDVQIASGQESSPLPAVEFYPTGGSNGASFLVEKRNQKAYRIKVHLITGLVEVEAV